MFKLKKESGVTANFSIILPGICNANCDFCFWERDKIESPLYVQQLIWYLVTLGEKVTQISITGGEPTISPIFDHVIEALRQLPQKKVVLTTNGYGLKEKLKIIDGVVQHINISRHSVDDKINREIFKTNSVPDKKELGEICDISNSMNIDITLNKVVSYDYDNLDELIEYIKFIKEIGASSLAIRKDYSFNTLDLIPLEINLGLKGIKRGCPVCMTNSYLYKGIPIHFKMSLEEPSETLNWIYEFIYHPSGILTEDWKGLKPIEFIVKNNIEKESIYKHSPSIYSSSCGQSHGRSSC